MVSGSIMHCRKLEKECTTLWCNSIFGWKMWREFLVVEHLTWSRLCFWWWYCWTVWPVLAVIYVGVGCSFLDISLVSLPGDVGWVGEGIWSGNVARELLNEQITASDMTFVVIPLYWKDDDNDDDGVILWNSTTATHAQHRHQLFTWIIIHSPWMSAQMSVPIVLTTPILSRLL